MCTSVCTHPQCNRPRKRNDISNCLVSRESMTYYVACRVYTMYCEHVGVRMKQSPKTSRTPTCAAPRSWILSSQVGRTARSSTEILRAKIFEGLILCPNSEEACHLKAKNSSSTARKTGLGGEAGRHSARRVLALPEDRLRRRPSGLPGGKGASALGCSGTWDGASGHQGSAADPPSR